MKVSPPAKFIPAQCPGRSSARKLFQAGLGVFGMSQSAERTGLARNEERWTCHMSRQRSPPGGRPGRNLESTRRCWCPRTSKPPRPPETPCQGAPARCSSRRARPSTGSEVKQRRTSLLDDSTHQNTHTAACTAVRTSETDLTISTHWWFWMKYHAEW